MQHIGMRIYLTAMAMFFLLARRKINCDSP